MLFKEGKYYQIDPKLFPYGRWRAKIDEAVKNGNQNWILNRSISSGTLECSTPDKSTIAITFPFPISIQYTDCIKELPEFKGFKKGYYYRYWRSDSKYPSCFVYDMKPFFDGNWHCCKSAGRLSVTIFDSVPNGSYCYFSTPENFHEFYQELSPEEYNRLLQEKDFFVNIDTNNQKTTSTNGIKEHIVDSTESNNIFVSKTKIRKL
jgi:hypothetical protein